MKGSFRNKQGSTLLEIVVAIAVLGLMVAPVCSSLVLSHRLNAESERLLQTRLLLESTAERLMGEGIDKAKINAQQYYIVDYAEETGVRILTDYSPDSSWEKQITEPVLDDEGNPVKDDNGNYLTETRNVELWYDVTISFEDIEIKTIVKAAPEYVEEDGEGGDAS